MTNAYKGVQHILAHGGSDYVIANEVCKAFNRAGTPASLSTTTEVTVDILWRRLRINVLTSATYASVYTHLGKEFPEWLSQTTLSLDYYSRYFLEDADGLLFLFIDEKHLFDDVSLRLIAKGVGVAIGADYLTSEGETTINATEMFNDPIETVGLVRLKRLTSDLLTK